MKKASSFTKFQISTSEYEVKDTCLTFNNRI